MQDKTSDLGNKTGATYRDPFKICPERERERESESESERHGH